MIQRRFKDNIYTYEDKNTQNYVEIANIFVKKHNLLYTRTVSGKNK